MSIGFDEVAGSVDTWPADPTGRVAQLFAIIITPFLLFHRYQCPCLCHLPESCSGYMDSGMIIP